MKGVLRIILPLVLTVIGGVAVFVIGQILVRFFIEPVHELRKAIGEVGDALIYYAHLYMQPKEIAAEAGGWSAGSPLPPVYGEDRGKASEALRQKASLIFIRANAVPKYSWFVRLRAIPSWESLMIGHKELINLSNSVSRGNPVVNAERRRIISEALDLHLGI